MNGSGSAPVNNTAAAPPTRSQEVYQRLRDAIVRGELRPNERLVEAELANRLQVSRTPVRECLPRLATEGLIVNRGHGWAVLEHTPEQIREIYEVRAALEGYASRLAAERADDEQLDVIAALSPDPAAMAQLARGDVVPANERFHDAVIAAAGNERLAQAIRRTRAYYFNYRIAAVYSSAELHDAFAAHQTIAEAVRRRDANAAEQLTRDHVSEALDLAVNKL